MRRSAVIVSALLALVIGVTTAFAAGIEKDLRALQRPRRSYDTLPASAKTLAAQATTIRRVATALDSGKRAYFIYIVITKDKRFCTVLVQQTGYTANCAALPLALEKGRRTTAVYNGLVGGVAANDVKRVVLQGGSRQMRVPLTSDNGYIFGCPAPSKCAAWVKTILGYNAAGKLISRESLR